MKDKVITIGREFGSGGREIGRDTAPAVSFLYKNLDLIIIICYYILVYI